MSKSMKLWASFGLAGILPMANRQQSGAPAPAADDLRLQEVVVTARKREESLQDVPLSITAFTAESIEARGIDSVYDLARLTPNLSFNQSYGRGVLDRPVIRGQSNLLGARTVSFVVDGVYIAGNLAADLDDVAQVEVLKGPQAANYGRAALAGVISYRTRRPTETLTGKASVSAGDDGYGEATASISGPIVDGKLGFKLGSRYYTYDGQYTGRSSDGRTVKMGAEKTQRYAGSLYWTPTEDFDFTLRNVRPSVTNCPQVLEGEFRSFTPRTSVRYDINEDANVYVSAARGNRPGAFNTALWGRNVGNERAADSLVRLGNPDNGDRAYLVHYPNGRQIGLSVGYESGSR